MSFPRHSSYKESGVEWLGRVPSHWEIVPFKRLVEIQNGADYKHVEQNEGYPVIGSGGVFTFASDFLYDGESVLLGRKGTVDKPLYVTGRFWTVDTMYWTKIRPGICGRFAFYTATTIPFGYYSTSTALPSMTKGALNANPVGLPSLAEQVAIADFLDCETTKIDALIEEQRRLVDLLTEKHQAVISRAVTNGLNPDASMKDSGVEWLGNVPSHWDVDRIAVLFREANESATNTAAILSVSIHDGVSDDERLPENSERKISRIEDRTKYKAVQPGDLVYNMMRAWQGAFGTVKVNGAVSPAYVVARPISPLMTEFVEWVLRTPQCVEELRRHSAGVTDFRLRLYWDEFRNIRVPVPPLEEQRSILSNVTAEASRCQRLIDEAQVAISLLYERRAALVSAAVTGKIDVRGQTTIHSTYKPDLRLIVGSAIVGSLARKPTFGRVKFQKLLFLAETHAGVDLGGIYTREAAGPLDRDLVADVERRLVQAARAEVCQPEGPGGQVEYRALKPLAEFESELERLGDAAARLQRIIDLFADLDTRFTEAVTTLYAVWNDALIDRRQPTTNDIVGEVLNDWHPEKKEKFRADELQIWLGWMDRHGLVPTGKEPRTALGRLFA